MIFRNLNGKWRIISYRCHIYYKLMTDFAVMNFISEFDWRFKPSFLKLSIKSSIKYNWLYKIHLIDYYSLRMPWNTIWLDLTKAIFYLEKVCCDYIKFFNSDISDTSCSWKNFFLNMYFDDKFNKLVNKFSVCCLVRRNEYLKIRTVVWLIQFDNEKLNLLDWNVVDKLASIYTLYNLQV